MKTISSLLVLLMLCCAAYAQSARFGQAAPAGWQLSAGWQPAADGTLAAGDCTATCKGELPAACLVEAIFILPSADKMAAGAKISLTAGEEGKKGAVTVQSSYTGTQYAATLAGANANGDAISVPVSGDTRPSILIEQEKAKEHTGWAGKTVSLGLMLDPAGCRLFINGVQAAEMGNTLPVKRLLSLSANGIKLLAVNILPGPPAGYDYLSGVGVAMNSGGETTCKATVDTTAAYDTTELTVNGIPMLAQVGKDGLAALDIAAEKWQGQSWSEGNGFLRMPVASRPYSAAYLLVYRQPGKRAAMGFGLRPHEMSAGDLKNIYLDRRPDYQPDQGVTVKAVPALGQGWYQVRVPLNPAELQWYTHSADGKLLPPEKRTDIEAYFCRPWLYGAIPCPDGQPSGLCVAAVTLEESPIDLTVTGNGLGNVYAQPEGSKLTATITNRTGKPLKIAVSTELIPFGQKPSRQNSSLSLLPGESRSLNALAAPIRNIGHYRVRVTADAGTAHIDYRTNTAVVAPDTRKKIDSPFGVWSKLWTDNSTPAQEQYLKKLAGIGFWMGKDAYDIRMDIRVPDDATAEELIKKVPPEAKILMFGWEHTWTMDQTFAFPRLISEGKFEDVTPEVKGKMDDLAVEWRRLAKATRKLRPDLKISLGNSAVNFTAAFLERGFKPGVDFDYWGTEEGLFDELPEAPADAVGNINWWTKAVAEHYGYKNVPLFHSETVYYSSGPGFSRMTEPQQAGYYSREYMLGFPYNSIFAFSAAMVDSSNSYIYSIWGMVGYCNQAPECSPKLSYNTYAALTQLLDCAKYDGRLDAGTTSLYALRFRKPDGSFIYAIWNLRGERRISLKLGQGTPQVVNALNQPLPAKVANGLLPLTATELPTYVSGVTIQSLIAGNNVPQRVTGGKTIGALASVDDWTVDTKLDTDFAAPREWRGMPKEMGNFTVTTSATPPAPGFSKAMTLTLQPLPGKHGLIPRYVTLDAKRGKEIAIPSGTTRLGLWVYGNSTWAQIKLGVRSKDGKTRLLLADDLASRMTDNFDGWRFVDTGYLADDEFQRRQWVIDRILVTMPEQQVYVDDLLTTKKPQIAIAGIQAFKDTLPAITYQPW